MYESLNNHEATHKTSVYYLLTVKGFYCRLERALEKWLPLFLFSPKISFLYIRISCQKIILISAFHQHKFFSIVLGNHWHHRLFMIVLDDLVCLDGLRMEYELLSSQTPGQRQRREWQKQSTSASCYISYLFTIFRWFFHWISILFCKREYRVNGIDTRSS